MDIHFTCTYTPHQCCNKIKGCRSIGMCSARPMLMQSSMLQNQVSISSPCLGFSAWLFLLEEQGTETPAVPLGSAMV
ncbi:hypothetical protein AV530_018944 [Patagioenas fasciata monilis]|uniref:Uncharacterized protein n=1 Tax=Patagioenas fasciata monilis TaxID=372326 RepID=A0A1V4K344_PATFA|nr:hypothetical protein AV530_018944 [Patagioenas fasciata monilis]